MPTCRRPPPIAKRSSTLIGQHERFIMFPIFKKKKRRHIFYAVTVITIQSFARPLANLSHAIHGRLAKRSDSKGGRSV